MDEEKIHTFLTLADNLSFTKTAAAMHKSQSVVSRQILSFESEIGFPLFVRDSRYCSLTASGKKLAEGLRRIEKEYLQVIKEAKLLQEGKSGSLVIGMHGGETTSPYRNIFNAFHEAYPEISITFADYRVTELNRRMEDMEIDLAQVVTCGHWFASSRSMYKYIPCGIRHVCLFIHKSHRLFDAPAESLTLRDFKDDVFIVFSGFEPDYSTGLTMQALAAGGIDPEIKTCSTLTAAVIMLEAGHGVMLSSSHLSISSNSDFRKLYFPPYGTQEEAMAWLPENSNPCLSIFTDFLQRYVEKNPSVLTDDPLYP